VRDQGFLRASVLGREGGDVGREVCVVPVGFADAGQRFEGVGELQTARVRLFAALCCVVL